MNNTQNFNISTLTFLQALGCVCIYLSVCLQVWVWLFAVCVCVCVCVCACVLVFVCGQWIKVSAAVQADPADAQKAENKLVRAGWAG